jgi:hypothetical protein
MNHHFHFIFVPHLHVVAPYRPFFAFHGGGGLLWVVVIMLAVFIIAATAGRGK